MKIILGKTAGFCWGVKRAMEIVDATLTNGANKVYTSGPLIHNQEVVDRLAAKGVKAIEDFRRIREGTVIIRTHGMPPKTKLRLVKKGLHTVDATCPHVSKTQKQVEDMAGKGYSVVIVGDPKHAEVVGLVGHASGQAKVVSSIKDARTLAIKPPIFVAAQSTFSGELFRKVVECLRMRHPDLAVFDSICRSATNRQREVLEIAKKADAMIVVGGSNSANTRRLAQISKSTGRPTFLVENASQLPLTKLGKFKKVGVTAGASTPDWAISEVIERLMEL